MITNTDLTIVNKVFNDETREDSYIATYVTDASWYADFKAGIGENGLKSGDVYKVRIPYEESTNDIKVAKGSIVVRGFINVSENDTPKSIMKDREAFIVTSFSYNLRGTLKHLRIFGT